MTVGLSPIHLFFLLFILFNPMNLCLMWMVFSYMNLVKKQQPIYDGLFLLLLIYFTLCVLSTGVMVNNLFPSIIINTDTTAQQQAQTEVISNDVCPKLRPGVRDR